MDIGVEDVQVRPVAKQPVFAPRPAIRSAVSTLTDLAVRQGAGEGDSWHLAELMAHRPDALRKVATHYREAARYLGLTNVKVAVYSPDKLNHPFTWQQHANGPRMFGIWSLWLHFEPEPLG